MTYAAELINTTEDLSILLKQITMPKVYATGITSQIFNYSINSSQSNAGMLDQQQKHTFHN